ncbi:Serine/threonine protein kinase [Nannocystis exedens]|uniref:Serine/threonine protein kinase n=1 Tax=Nannocystis exedens TaxID=54 RepID=A0A1I2HYZ8_9BACT|nr:serine/threonine-protein kinase [Nannocystis exedens]PCC67040.1 serine/threonine protein kinase [Nannocystis exedens]SFF35142.1 Serine/threonine protein kinase [Nannocystis exedens]
MGAHSPDDKRSGPSDPDLLATTDTKSPALDVTARARPSPIEETVLAAPGRRDSTPVHSASGVSLRGPAAPLEDSLLRQSRRIGRYAILSELGEGGMGVVLSGYDEVLERRVAIKVVRSHHRQDERLQARLLREAQALARLSHPNVVQVYEAGTIGDELFIAMEFVRGVTLSAWLEDRERTQQEILTVFSEAGRGLAAAHRVGLTHRDFKPGNVLVDLEGRVRVVDFGLAALAEQAERRPAGDELVDLGVERTVFFAGTPAYMSPEQWLGGQVDARTDQFSFCVALWEALWGSRPFAGQTVDELREQVLVADLPERVQVGPRVGKRLYRVLARGLARAPDARYPSMDALLADLAGPQVRARHAVVGLGLGAVIGLAAAAWSFQDEGRCLGGETRLIGVWDSDRRDAAADAFEATGLGFADEAWTHVANRLDARAEAIVAMHRDACEAHARGEQSEHLLDLRMACLSRHVHEVRAVTDLLVAADAGVVERAVDAVAALPPIERCADVAVLRAEVPPPADPATALAVDNVRRALANVAALEHTGRYEAGLLGADQAVAAAEAAAYAPAVAEAQLARGRLLALLQRDAEAETSLRAAFTTATASRQDAVARDAAAALVETLNTLGRLDHAEVWLEIAAAAQTRAPDEGAAALLDLARSKLLWSLGRYAESEALIERSVAAYDALHGADNPATARARQWFGTALWARQEFDRSKAVLPDSRARLERAFGPEHPEVAAALRYEGNLYFVLTDFDAALATWRRGLDIILRTRGEDDPLVVVFQGNIAAALARARRPIDAVAAFEAVVRSLERRHGPDNIELCTQLDNLGASYLEAGQLGPAREVIDRSLAIRRRVLGDDHAEVARSLLGLGEWGLYARDYATAIPAFERALAIRAGTDVHALLRGRAEYGLARALWLSERDRVRARALIDRALATFTALGPAGSLDLTEATAWRDENVTPGSAAPAQPKR